MKRFVMPSEGIALEEEKTFCQKENSLASFAIVQSKSFIFSCGYELITSVIKANPSYVSRPRIG
jgi:hypothetical protein